MTRALAYVLLFVAVRLAYLIFLNPYYFAQFHYEELYRGLIGFEWMQGRNFPFLSYRPDDYSGAWIFVGFFLSKVFSLIGPTVFALKTWALTCSAITLFFWHQTLTRYCNERVAAFFSLLFIFAPPSLMIYSLTSMGDHAETMMFTSVSVFLMNEILFKSHKTLLLSAFLGLVLGLGIWFNLGVTLTLLALMIFWVVRDSHFFMKKSFWVFLMFLCVGISPAILIYFKLPQVEGIHGKSFSSLFGLNYLFNAFRDYHLFVGYSVLNSLRAPIWGISSFYKWMTVLCYSVLLFVPMFFLFFLPQENKEPKWKFFLICFVSVYLLVFQLSDFKEIRFWMAFMPFLFIGTAMGLDALLLKYSKSLSDIRTLFVGATLLFFIFTNLPLLSAKHAGTVFTAKGYHYSFVDSSVCKEAKKCLENYSFVAEKLSPEDRYAFSTALALQLVTERPVEDVRESVAEHISVLPESFKPYYFYFWGREIMEQSEGLQIAINITSLFGKEARIGVEQGILDVAGSVSPYDLLESSDRVSPEAYGRYWRSVGESIASDWNRPINFRALNREINLVLESYSEKSRPFLLQGIGRFLYHYWSLRPLKPFYDSKQIEIISKSFYDDVFLGVGMAWAERSFLWRIATFSWYWREFAESLQKRNQEKILQGRAFVSGALGAWHQN